MNSPDPSPKNPEIRKNPCHNRHDTPELPLVSAVLAVHLAMLFLFINLATRPDPSETIQPPEPLKMVMVDMPPVPLAASAGSLSTPGVRSMPSSTSPAPDSRNQPENQSKNPLSSGTISRSPLPKQRPTSSESPSAARDIAPPPDHTRQDREIATLEPSPPASSRSAQGDAAPFPAAQGATQEGSGAKASAEPASSVTGGNGRSAPAKTAFAASSPTSEGLIDGPARFGAAYLNNPAPKYPPTARRMGEQGKVLLRVLVTMEGLAKTVVLNRSSGYEALDHSALKAVQQWRFVPARRGGSPVEAWVQVPILFRLD